MILGRRILHKAILLINNWPSLLCKPCCIAAPLQGGQGDDIVTISGAQNATASYQEGSMISAHKHHPDGKEANASAGNTSSSPAVSRGQRCVKLLLRAESKSISIAAEVTSCPSSERICPANDQPPQAPNRCKAVIGPLVLLCSGEIQVLLSMAKSALAFAGGYSNDASQIKTFPTKPCKHRLCSVARSVSCHYRIQMHLSQASSCRHQI